MRALKIAGLSSAAVFGFLLICIGLFAGFFNPNDYKNQLETWVKAQTGRTFTFQGELQLQLYPRLAIATSQFVLSDTSQFGPEPLLRARRAAVNLRLLPLLRGHVSLGAVTLEGVQLQLLRNRDGVGNWQDLLQRLSRASGESSATKSGLRWTEMREFNLHEAGLYYEDRHSGARYRIEQFELHARDVRLQQPFQLEAAANVMTNAKWQTQWQVRSTVLLDGERQRYVLTKPQLHAVITGADLPAGGVPLTFTAVRAQLDQRNGQAELANFVIAVASAELQGQLTFSGLNNSLQMNGQFALAPFNLRTWLLQMGKPLPAMRDRNALNTFSMTGHLQATTNSLTALVSALTLDETHMTGQLQLQNFSDRRVMFSLQADRINLDRYLAPVQSNQSPTPVPLAWLRSLHASGVMTVQQAQWQGRRTQQLTLQLADE